MLSSTCKVSASLPPQETLNFLIFDGPELVSQDPPAAPIISYRACDVRRGYLCEMAGKKTPSRKRNRESSRTEPTTKVTFGRFSDFFVCQKHPFFQKYLPICETLLQGPIPKKEKVEESSSVKYKTVPCKKYWTVGHCELGPRCDYIHQVRVVSIICDALFYKLRPCAGG